jgi:[acyl-carrier-protein] S-malonyltransferase
VPLQVSAPFHCALMQPAQDRLAALLAGLEFKHAQVPVVVNVDAEAVTEGARLREALVRQVTGPVRWVESMRAVLGMSAAERAGQLDREPAGRVGDEPEARAVAASAQLIEVGPGKVLSGLMRQIDRAQTVWNVEDKASLEKTLAALSA